MRQGGLPTAPHVGPALVTRARAGCAAASVGGAVYILGGHDGEMPLKVMEKYLPGESIADRGRWEELPPMLARRTYCSVESLGTLIYAIGGSADGRTLNTFEVFNAESGEWAQWFTKPPMQTKRTLHGSAVASERLFVCGGFDGLRDLSTVEEYDPKTNIWQWKNNMNRGRSYLAVTVVDESIYAIGGQDRGKGAGPRAHDTVEVFDLYSERWRNVANLGTGRAGLGAAALKGEDDLDYIFVCGGSDGDIVLASAERYDPRADAWTEAPPMNTARLGHAVAVVNNRLYAIGGSDGKECLDTYECFDPVQLRWGPLQKMAGWCEEFPCIGISVASSAASSSPATAPAESRPPPAAASLGPVAADAR